MTSAGRRAAHRQRSWPLLGDLPAFRADRLGFFTRLARTQGDVARFRIGPFRGWSLAHPDDIGGVLVTHADRFQKGPVLQRARLVLGDGLLTAEGETHRTHRRLLQQAFHPARIVAYGDTMVARTSSTIDRWRPREPIDVHEEMVRITLATAGETLLGADVERDVPIVERAIDDLLRAYKLAFVPFGWRLQDLPVGPARHLRRGREALHALIDRIVAERRATGRDTGDLLSALVLGVGDDEQRLSDRQVREHAVTLLLAGHETTANALSFALHLVATNPAIEEAVGHEVDEVAANRPPSVDQLDRLVTCRSLIAEALRLYPPSWALGRQALHDHPVGGHVVRTGEMVVLSPWVVHRDPRWWPDPTRPDPARHLDSAARDRPRWAYLPFGAGVRRCIGEGFAWTEGTLALATIVQRWRLRPTVDHPLALEPLITLRPRGGLQMVPERR